MGRIVDVGGPDWHCRRTEFLLQDAERPEADRHNSAETSDSWIDLFEDRDRAFLENTFNVALFGRSHPSISRYHCPDRGNVVIEEAILSVRTAVEQGKSFVEPLRAAELFPHMVSQMVGIGEQTGALDSMLGKIADFYEQEVDSAIANLLTLIEPVLIGFLGVTIGSIVIAMYLPMFTLIGKLSQGH
jgi:hypothetical protein